MPVIVSFSRGNIQVAYYSIVYWHSAYTHALTASKTCTPPGFSFWRPLINTYRPFDVAQLASKLQVASLLRSLATCSPITPTSTAALPDRTDF